MMGVRNSFRGLAAAGLLAGASLSPAGANTQMPPAARTTPVVGQKAPDFVLVGLDGATVRLADQKARGPVVLVVLRGWPGYHCPFCTRQFADYLAHASDLQAAGAQVLFVYPGPADGIHEHARDFIAARPMPGNFRILLDPDYAVTQAYGLRWDAPKETAYPSTFVLDALGHVTFARTSRAHDGRVPVADVLAALAAAGKV